MLDCLILFKDKEYTRSEFKAFVLENGIGSLLGDSPSNLASNIVTKLDFARQEESISEMWARLEAQKKDIEFPGFPTKKDVESILNPPGQLTDYATQREIRYNTYSGIALTGISANFGKGLGYLFETTPVKSITNVETGEIIEEYSDGPDGKINNWKPILAKFNTSNIDTLFQKTNKYKVNERFAPKIKKEAEFLIDNQVIDGFVRNTREFWGNVAKNVFETVDTIINLAIDNVKEGQLHRLGITNANANLYLSMVGMGIPLNIVSRIFKTPVLQEINESGQRADEKNIAKRIKEIEKYFENNPPSFPYLNSINTEMLDKIYVGEATEVEQKLHDLIVLQTMQKLNPLGSELFDFAKIYGSLRGLPNKKWQINDVIKTIEKYGIFKDEVNKVKTIQQGFSDYISEVFIEQSPEYKKLIEENKIEEAEQLVQDSTKEVKDDSILFGSKMALLRSNYINRVLRRSAARGLENNPGVSSFTNVIPLRLPHILASYRSLLQTQNILNKTFAVYNKTVTDFVEKIIRDANIFTEFNSSSSTELISKELIKFLSADMEFNLDNRLFSTLVPEDQKFYTASRTFEGKEAWAQQFISKFKELLNAGDFEENEFSKALEIKQDELTGLWDIKMVADKVNDEEIVREIRDAFLSLATNKNPIAEGKSYTRAEAARDLFKYALLTSSMYFERTGFALVFPEHWVVSYSLALENRLQSVIPNGEVRTAVNLAVLRDKFMLQLLSNNPNLLEKSFNKPIPLGKGKVANKSVTNFAGKDIVDGKTVHFDMKFPVVPEKEPSQFITHYSGGVFVLIPTTPNAAYNYYVKVAETPKHRFYSFDPATIEQSIDLSLLTSGNTPLVHSGDIINGKYRTNPLVPIYEVGDVISAIDKLNSSSTELMTFRITNKAVVGNTGVTYTLHYTGKVDISKVSEAAAARKRLLYFTRERLSTTLTVPDVNAKNTDGTRKYIPTAGQKVLATLDIPTVKDDLPVDEQLELAASLINKVEALDKSVGYWVNSNILDNLKENVITRSKVSEALANQIGFKDPLENNNLQSTADDVNAFFIALKRTELIKQTLGNGNPITRVEGRSYTHTIPNNGTALGTLPGDLLYAGNKNYFYVYGVTKDVLQITQFPEAVFKLMEQENYTVEEFENIYSKIINC